MMEKNIFNPYPMEPAHPMVVKLYDDLVKIYRFVKQNYQTKIDAAFDKASQQIGFVIATTMPIVLEVGERGAIKSISMGSESLKGTAFETEIFAALGPMKKGESKLDVSPGIYDLAIFWHDAVKLRLATDWMEPAHPVYQLQSELMGIAPESARMARDSISWHKPWCEPAHTPWLEPVHHGPWCRPWMEPAHPVYQSPAELKRTEAARMFEHQEPVQWLDKANLIAQEKSVLLSAIDEVYPELKLGERMNKARYATSTNQLAAWPGIREPAHMMAMQPWAMGPFPQPWRQAMAEIAQVISRFGPLPDPWREQMLSEIANALARFGYEMLNPQPLPPKSMMAWHGVKEPAHMMAMQQWAAGPTPELWRQTITEIAQVIGRLGPQPDPWKEQMISEIANVLGRLGYGMLNPQPLPPRSMMAWHGVKEPAHMMAVPPWWRGDLAQAPMPAEVVQQLIAEIGSVFRKYGYQL
jgi:hypothetical protein